MDTGAIIDTTVRWDLVTMWRLSETPGNYAITRAGREIMGVSSEILVYFKIGMVRVFHIKLL